jgi:hypothetical protein
MGGVLVAFALNTGLREGIFILSENYESYELTFWSIVLGVLFGLFMP